MLPAHLQELLTASVDGELSNAERRVVDRLLRDSAEARVFHNQLLHDANLLRQAPVASPREDFASNILGIIDERGMKPTPLPMPRRQPSWNNSNVLRWASLATAAVVLLSVSVGSYIFFAMDQKQTAEAKKDTIPNPTQPRSIDEQDRLNNQATKLDHETLPKMNVPEREQEPAPLFVKNDPPTTPEQLPNPRLIGPDDVHALPPQPEPQPFRVVDINNLPLLLPLRDLDQAYPKKQLRDELKRDQIVRIDLFCKEISHATDLAQVALKSRGLTLMIDASAHDRLKKRLRSEIVVYTEALSHEEIAQLLEALSAEDKKLEARTKGEGQFDKFMLTPFHADDVRELSRLLGVPVSSLKLPKIRTSSSFDPSKSLESSTASQLAATLPKNGSSSRNDRPALIMVKGPGFANPLNSKEIKAFLDKRGDRKPGMVPMMLVLRTIN